MSHSKPFFITTAIDYANGDPHLGHALEKIGADSIARWHRLKGESVYYLMGMDEHGQKVYQAATEQGNDPKTWIDGISTRFEGVWRQLHCSHDDWMRTTQPRHARTVKAMIEAIQRCSPGDLFQGEYEGLYCVGCEEFKAENQIVDGRCLEHPSRELVKTSEKNTFFRLSRWRDEVRDAITSGRFRVEPAIRRNEILAVLDEGLQDISVSRSRLPWGIPFPGTDDETVYVWFDALINYLSATGYPEGNWQRLWPADLHVVGKGITRFHCIIWPAMLMSAELPLPAGVWAHGYVQWGGAKVSKSEGKAISLDEMISRHGPDPLRWFLLREVGFTNDGDFTLERFDAVYESELANGIGNLASRVLAMIEKYCSGVVPAGGEEESLETAGVQAVVDYAAAMDAVDLKGGAREINELVAAANSYITSEAPWSLAKSAQAERLAAVLGALARCLIRITAMAIPLMPVKSLELSRALGGKVATEGGWKLALSPDIASVKISKPENLFPRA